MSPTLLFFSLFSLKYVPGFYGCLEKNHEWEMNVTYAELSACSAKRSVRRSSEQTIKGLLRCVGFTSNCSYDWSYCLISSQGSSPAVHWSTSPSPIRTLNVFYNFTWLNNYKYEPNRSCTGQVLKFQQPFFPEQRRIWVVLSNFWLFMWEQIESK